MLRKQVGHNLNSRFQYQTGRHHTALNNLIWEALQVSTTRLQLNCRIISNCKVLHVQESTQWPTSYIVIIRFVMTGTAKLGIDNLTFYW